MGMLSNIGKVFLNSWPQRCLLCAAPAGAPLCPACRDSLPRLDGPACPRCALPVPAAGSPHEAGVCGACLSQPPRYDRVVAACVYEHPLAELVQHYKYNDALALGPEFAQLLAPRVDRGVDLMLPLPLSRRRLRERGYNQALEIARVLHRLTGVPLAPRACRRVRDTPPQVGLDWETRARNVRGAFECVADVRGKRVAVVDDVLTSGATLNEMAKVLKRAGAAEVQGWVVARAL